VASKRSPGKRNPYKGKGEPPEKRPPYKFTEERKKAYLELLRGGGRRHASARAIGISPWTAVNHMNNDPEFRAAVEQAEMEANENVENALYEAALAGNVTAIQVWLYNRAAGLWSDKRVAPVAIAQATAVSDAGAVAARARAEALTDGEWQAFIDAEYRYETGGEPPEFDDEGSAGALGGPERDGAGEQA